jgi:TPP-dependent indolepyruvate ferredoxin oxidoreductase alpha subunit
VTARKQRASAPSKPTTKRWAHRRRQRLARWPPCRAIAAFKSVGVHVASDALALGNLAGAHPQGGAVIIMGDDPWCDSTQVPADSRFLCEHLRMAGRRAGHAAGMKDWIDLSFKLSQAAGLYVGYIVTTAQADGGGTVECKPNQFPDDQFQTEDSRWKRKLPGKACCFRRAPGSRN